MTVRIDGIGAYKGKGLKYTGGQINILHSIGYVSLTVDMKSPGSGYPYGIGILIPVIAVEVEGIVPFLLQAPIPSIRIVKEVWTSLPQKELPDIS